MVTEMHIMITGEIENTGYIDLIADTARDFGVHGWVKETQGSNIQVVGQGYPDELRAFAAEIQKGPPLAGRKDVSVVLQTIRVLYDDFAIRV